MEKRNFREMLAYLSEEKGLPLLMTAKEAADALGCSQSTVLRLAAAGQLKTVGTRITIGSVASLLLCE